MSRRRRRSNPLPKAVLALAAAAAFVFFFDGGSVGDLVADLRLPDAVARIVSESPTSRQTAGPIPICSGGNRAERRLTCIVDGDTGWHQGTNWRLVRRSGGVDAPEISRPDCAAERAAGQRATDRLRTLMAGGYYLSATGTDRYGRTLARITLADGRDAGDVLIAEGHAQAWPNSGNPWCR